MGLKICESPRLPQQPGKIYWYVKGLEGSSFKYFSPITTQYQKEGTFPEQCFIKKDCMLSLKSKFKELSS